MGDRQFYFADFSINFRRCIVGKHFYGQGYAQPAPAKTFQQGSCPNITLTPDFGEVVVGFSKKNSKYKLLGGKIELCDVPSAISLTDIEREEQTAENCAKRELFREGGITDEHTLSRCKLKYERIFKGGTVKQYYFLVLLKERPELTTEIIESDEMYPPEYWPTITVLRGGEYGKKFNPFHQLALCKCIQEMRNAGLGHDVNFPGFQRLLQDIYDAGIDLDAFTLELAGKLENGEI